MTDFGGNSESCHLPAQNPVSIQEAEWQRIDHVDLSAGFHPQS